MDFLEESKQKYLEAGKRIAEESARRIKACLDSGGHDESKGTLIHHFGSMSYRMVQMQSCAVRIEFAGQCPKCGTFYTREPTREEMQTPVYKELRQDLMTPEKLEKMLTTPITI